MNIVANGNGCRRRPPRLPSRRLPRAHFPAGRYKVVVQVHLEGSATPGAADLDNMGLFSDSTNVAVLAVPEAKAVLFTSLGDRDRGGGGQGAVGCPGDPGNATTAVVYSATLRAHPDALFP